MLEKLVKYLQDYAKHYLFLSYSIAGGIMLLYFVYSGFTGKVYFSKPTENWSPDGHTERHSHTRGHRSSYYYHK